MNKSKKTIDKNTKIKAIQALMIILITIILSLVIFIIGITNIKNTLSMSTYAINYEEKTESIKLPEQKNEEDWDILKTIQENTQKVKKEEISQEEEDLEYTTIYKTNKDLPKGMLQVVQEGRDGKQQVVTKKYYEGEELVNETISYNILIAALDKIVEIGGANYSSNYKVKVGDILYVTSNTLAVRVLPDKTSDKIITISKNQEVKLLEIQENWYKIKYNTYMGYIPKDCVTYINPTKGAYVYSEEKNKNEILSGLSKNISLNKPSGLSLDQFKKILSGDSKDKNKVFQNNAEYFYYAEKQYNLNGVFLAAVGIHESAWGTSKISLDKRNLFGYGASDSNPYGNAKNFATYEEGIDLVARVFVKYYVNAPGTSIYDGGTATGRYYNGPTLSGVNQRYATDKKWSDGVYKWMSYLYNRL